MKEGKTAARVVRAAMLLLGLVGAAGASSVAQHPAYAAAQLDCARYHESARSEIETQSAGRLRRAVAERAGSWTFRASDTTGGIALEGWYDSLRVRHGTGDSLAAPDTDGIIGGRYRGVLRSTGEYERLMVPFVPDEIAEAVDAAAALDELFPRLPPGPLAVGARWRESEGLELERLPDSSAGRPLQRYALRGRSEASEAIPHGDSVPIPLRQITTDESRLVWDPQTGLLRRDRTTVIEASIPAGGRVRTPVRSRVVQHAELRRLERSASCR